MQPTFQDHAPKTVTHGYLAFVVSVLHYGPGLGYVEFWPSRNSNWSSGHVRIFCIHARSSRPRRWRAGAGEKRNQVCRKSHRDVVSSLILRPRRAWHEAAILWTYCSAPESRPWLLSERGTCQRISRTQKQVSFLARSPSVKLPRRKTPRGPSQTKIAGFQKSPSSPIGEDYCEGTSRRPRAVARAWILRLIRSSRFAASIPDERALARASITSKNTNAALCDSAGSPIKAQNFASRCTTIHTNRCSFVSQSRHRAPALGPLL